MIQDLLIKTQKQVLNRESIEEIKITEDIPNFVMREQAFQTQFHVHFQNRLNKIGQIFRNNYPNKKFISITQLSHDPNADAFVVVMVQKKIKNFVSYIKKKESPESDDFLDQVNKNIHSVQDKVMIEDTTGRIRLQSEQEFHQENLKKFTIHSFTTGCVIAVKGQYDKEGLLFPSEFLFLNQKETLREQQKDQKMLLISNLGLSRRTVLEQKLSLLRNFLQEHNSLIDACDSIMFFGGTIAQLQNLRIENYGSYQFQENYKQIQTDIEHQSLLLDKILVSLLNKSDTNNPQVFLQPSLRDPVSTSLPQEKFSRIILSQSKNYQNLKLMKNPDIIQTSDGVKILLLDNNFVLDYQRQTDLDTMDVVKMFLSLRCYCPTAPNTIELLPFSKKDPLFMEEIPDYVFVSGGDKLEEDVFLNREGDIVSKIVIVPDFQYTGQVIQYNLKNNSIKIIEVANQF